MRVGGHTDVTSAQTAGDHARRWQIQQMQISALSEHLPVAAGGTIVVGVIATYLVAGTTNSIMLGSWCAAVVIVSLLRLLLHYKHRKLPTSQRYSRRYGLQMVVLIAVIGGLFSLLPLLFMREHDPQLGIAITVLLVGMTAGSAASESVVFRAFLVFAVPVVIALSWSVMRSGGEYGYLGLLGLPYLAVLVVMARNTSRAQRKSFALVIDNQRLLAQVTEEKQRAEQANLAKSHFLATATHDLRQPMQALSLYLGLLERKLNSAEQSAMLDKVNAAHDALNGLFERLLDISRLDAGIIEPQHEAVDVGAMVARIVDAYRADAKRHNNHITMSGPSVSVWTDPVLLERILDNLISNAVRFTHKGSVHIDWSSVGSDLQLSVCDTGVGIDPIHHDAIYQEFRQIHRRAHTGNTGLGLGLAIVQRLCRLLDYPLQLTSAEGRGSEFALTIPLASTVQQQEPAPAVTMGMTGMLQGCRVLVVDDDPAVRDALSQTLADWSCDVRGAGASQSTMAHLDQGFTPDLLICDYRLPDDATGDQVIEAVRHRIGREVPAVLITGDTAAPQLQSANSFEYPLLHKPVSPGQLRMAVHKVLA